MFVPLPLTVGIIIGAVAGLVTGSWVALVVAMLVIGLLVGGALLYFADAIVASKLGARPLADDGAFVIRNQLEEICARAGVNEPELMTVGPGAPAIASFGRSEPKLVVTDGLTDDLTVVELEAALAREVGRSKRRLTAGDTLATVFVTMPFGAFGSLSDRMLEWFRGGDHDARCDLEGVSITRYPPGLSAALSKMTADGTTTPDGSTATAHLWATGRSPRVGEPGIYGIEQRLELLSEL